MILTIIPTYSVANSVLSLLCPFTETKNKNQILSKLVERITLTRRPALQKQRFVLILFKT